MSLLFYIENFVVVGRTYPLIYTEEKEKGKTLFVEILLIGVGHAMDTLLYQFINCVVLLFLLLLMENDF